MQDTTSFINNVKNLKIKGHVRKAGLDAESLYPYIDHKKGTKACEHHLNQRNNRCISTKVLKHLLLLVLINTMMICDKYFFQTKRTAMRTPMAVNYINCLMGYFETNLLQDYKKTF